MIRSYLPMVGDVWLDCGDETCACCASFSTFRGESLKEGFFLCDFDLLARCFEKLSPWYLVRFDENIVEFGDSTSLYEMKGSVGDGKWRIFIVGGHRQQAYGATRKHTDRQGVLRQKSVKSRMKGDEGYQRADCSSCYIGKPIRRPLSAQRPGLAVKGDALLDASRAAVRRDTLTRYHVGR
jgi:hypothetical protein